MFWLPGCRMFCTMEDETLDVGVHPSSFPFVVIVSVLSDIDYFLTDSAAI